MCSLYSLRNLIPSHDFHFLENRFPLVIFEIFVFLHHVQSQLVLAAKLSWTEWTSSHHFVVYSLIVSLQIAQAEEVLWTIFAAERLLG